MLDIPEIRLFQKLYEASFFLGGDLVRVFFRFGNLNPGIKLPHSIVSRT